MSAKGALIEFLASSRIDPRSGKVWDNGAIVHFYSAGTLTNKAVWLDRDKTLPTVAGIYQTTLGADGSVLVFGDSVYDIKIYDAYDQDLTSPVRSFPAVNITDGTVGAELTDPVFLNGTDPTKKAGFNTDGISSGTQRNFSLPDKSGTIALVVANTNNFVNASDFGVIANGSHDDLAAINSAIGYCKANGFLRLCLPAGTIKTSAAFDDLATAASYDGISVSGSGQGNTIIDCTSLGSGVSPFTVTGGSGSSCGKQISDMTILGNGTQTGFINNGLCGYGLERVRFTNLGRGIYWKNGSVGSFTEYSIAENCVFDSNVVLKAEYAKVLGDASFHGTGLRNCMMNSPSGPSIKIGAGCYVYNAPMSFQIWAAGNGSSVIENNGLSSCSFHGDITFEGIDGDTIYAADPTKNAVLLVGNLCGVGKIRKGVLYPVENMIISGPSEGNLNRLELKPIYASKVLSAGANTVTGLVISDLGSVVSARVVGTGYEDRQEMICEHNGLGGAGIVTKIHQGFQANSAALAAWPAYTMSTGGDLVITMPADLKTAPPVTAYIRVSTPNSSAIYQA